jgi:hypothetical protein
MAKKKSTDESLKHIKKEDARKKDFKIREGQEESSIRSDKKKPDQNAYPHTTVEDKQYKNQPEFTERDNNVSKKT